ncbi:MAG TPA: outer membrane protein transport protein, partial [Holophagaceae bacterium]
SGQVSLESNQKTWYSSDRNRFLGGFGAMFRMSPRLTLGLKADKPFERHGAYGADAPNRFLGDRIDLVGHRLEAQAAWALTPALSVGFGLGVARLDFHSGTVLRADVPLDPTQPLSGTNPSSGLAEVGVVQSVSKTLPSYSLGFRWAINPRWTFGFAHQSGYRATAAPSAGFRTGVLATYANDGLSPALLGTSARAAALIAGSTPMPGTGRLELPSQTTLGVRHRLNPMLTWEGDLRWTAGGLQVPSLPGLITPSGSVTSPSSPQAGHGHLGAGLSMEVALGKLWTVRAGAFLDQSTVDATRVEPLMGGVQQAAFSAGASYKVWGGEISLGYQYRQARDQDVDTLNGVWSSSGYRPSGTRMRVEGMGHLWAIGYRRSF